MPNQRETSRYEELSARLLALQKLQLSMTFCLHTIENEIARTKAEIYATLPRPRIISFVSSEKDGVRTITELHTLDHIL